MKKIVTKQGNIRIWGGLKRSLFLALSLASVLGFFGCASQPEKKQEPLVLNWPAPPDEPRVRFLDTFASNFDVGDVSGVFARELFGEEKVVALQKPYGVATDKDGRIYATDIGAVFVFDNANRKLRLIGDLPGNGKLRIPIGVAISDAGKVYVSDSAADKIYMYDMNGKFLSTIGQPKEFEAPSGVAIDEKRQRLYVVDAKLHNVRAYGLADNKLQLTIGKRGTGKGEFNYPTNLAIDSSGNLYVADTMLARIQVFDPQGNYLKDFGQLGDAPGFFVRPKGVAIDSEDHVYVIDAAFQNFQIFDKEGKLLLFVGDGGNGPGQFMIPAGIAIDREDRIYIADQLNRRVQVFQYLGEKWKKKQADQPAPVPALPKQ